MNDKNAGSGVPQAPPKKGLFERLGDVIRGIKDFFVRLVRNFFAICTFALFIIIFTPLANYMVRPLIVKTAPVGRADLIVVLGGGALANGVLTGASNERLLHALELYRAGTAPRLLFVGASVRDATQKFKALFSDKRGGSTEPPPVPSAVEAAQMKKLALKLGFKQGALYAEQESLNTYENIRAVKEFMKKEDLGSCLVVTSPVHMFRARKVYERFHMNCRPAPVADYTPYVDSAVGRLSLFKEAVREYSAIVLYKFYGFI